MFARAHGICIEMNANSPRATMERNKMCVWKITNPFARLREISRVYNAMRAVIPSPSRIWRGSGSTENSGGGVRVPHVDAVNTLFATVRASLLSRDNLYTLRIAHVLLYAHMRTYTPNDRRMV